MRAHLPRAQKDLVNNFVGSVHLGHVWLASIPIMLSEGYPPSTAWLESNEFERFRTLAIAEYSCHMTRVLAGVEDVSNERLIGAQTTQQHNEDMG